MADFSFGEDVREEPLSLYLSNRNRRAFVDKNSELFFQFFSSFFHSGSWPRWESLLPTMPRENPLGGMAVSGSCAIAYFQRHTREWFLTIHELQ